MFVLCVCVADESVTRCASCSSSLFDFSSNTIRTNSSWRPCVDSDHLAISDCCSLLLRADVDQSRDASVCLRFVLCSCFCCLFIFQKMKFPHKGLACAIRLLVIGQGLNFSLRKEDWIIKSSQIQFCAVYYYYRLESRWCKRCREKRNVM